MVYLRFWMRKGKTFTGFYVADHFLQNIENPVVWFVTVFKAIPDIQLQHIDYAPRFSLVVKNYESLHKFVGKPHLIIVDEVHKIGKFPKPAKAAEQLKTLAMHTPIIYLSATPSPESFSQMYHPFWISTYSPLARWPNFYRFADMFVNKKITEYKGLPVTDYSDCDIKKLEPYINHVFVTVREDEGKKLMPVKHIPLYVDMSQKAVAIYNALKKDRIWIDDKGNAATCNSGAERDSKLLQIASGTLLLNESVDGILRQEGVIIDTSKADFIRSYFFGRKIAILYQYKAEERMLKMFFPDHTSDSAEFNSSTTKTFIGQIMTTKAGVNLSTADCMVMFNISHSAEAFIQGSARIQHIFKTVSPELYWIFSKHGPEAKIFNLVSTKKNEFTNYHYAEAQR